MHDHLKLDNLQDQLVIRHGQVEVGALKLCSILRDEKFFLPAFFDHYRRLGIEQFIVLDDGSIDGTFEFLREQPDCVVVTSSLRFGDRADVAYPDGNVAERRLGPVLRSVIARAFCSGQYALMVDADEFLILPQGLARLQDALSALETAGIRCVAANMVEFYPSSFSDIERPAQPDTFADLVALYPYFDAAPLLEMRRDRRPKTIRGSVWHRVLENDALEVTGLSSTLRGKISWLRRRISWLRPAPAKLPPAEKTPIIRWGDDIWMMGSHGANVLPTREVLLTLAHFKFTHNLVHRVHQAVEWRSHARQANNYRSYQARLDSMRRLDFQFCCDQTEAYNGPSQLERAELLKWLPCHGESTNSQI